MAPEPTTSQGYGVACFAQVRAIFPDIETEFLNSVSAQNGYDGLATVTQIAVDQEAGRPYERNPPLEGNRAPIEDETEATSDMTALRRRYDNPQRRATGSSLDRIPLAINLISVDFPLVPVETVRTLLQLHSNLLLPAYLFLEKALYIRDSNTPKPTSTTFGIEFIPDLGLGFVEAINNAGRQCIGAANYQDARESVAELDAARVIRASRDNTRAKMLDDNRKVECMCCFDEQPFCRMVGCNAESRHMFCIECARRNAETGIGQMRYELKCMSMDPCRGIFSQVDRKRFLDEKTIAILDRLEREAKLRLAGVANVGRCPVCEFPFECPPLEEKQEVQCVNPKCGKKFCRLCHKGSHMPMPCDGATADKYAARRGIEEAMSDALIRTCNKCNIPFVKESGCNLMSCPTPGCGNSQCYICSKSCDYSHFDKKPRRGEKGKTCSNHNWGPGRDQERVKKAGKKAREAAIEKDPTLAPELLDFHWSRRVPGLGKEVGSSLDWMGQAGVPVKPRPVQNRVVPGADTPATPRLQATQPRPPPTMEPVPALRQQHTRMTRVKIQQTMPYGSPTQGILPRSNPAQPELTRPQPPGVEARHGPYGNRAIYEPHTSPSNPRTLPYSTTPGVADYWARKPPSQITPGQPAWGGTYQQANSAPGADLVRRAEYTNYPQQQQHQQQHQQQQQRHQHQQQVRVPNYDLLEASRIVRVFWALQARPTPGGPQGAFDYLSFLQHQEQEAIQRGYQQTLDSVRAFRAQHADRGRRINKVRERLLSEQHSQRWLVSIYGRRSHEDRLGALQNKLQGMENLQTLEAVQAEAALLTQEVVRTPEGAQALRVIEETLNGRSLSTVQRRSLVRAIHSPKQ